MVSIQLLFDIYFLLFEMKIHTKIPTWVGGLVIQNKLNFNGVISRKLQNELL